MSLVGLSFLFTDDYSEGLNVRLNLSNFGPVNLVDRSALPRYLLYSVMTMILILGNPGIIAWSESNPPTISAKNVLTLQKIVDGLDKPSGFEFIGKQDILVTQKNDGKVKLLRNFDLKKYSILDVNIFNHTLDSGISGITSAMVGNFTYVFLSYTENPVRGGGSISPRPPWSENGVFRYVWDSANLTLSQDTLVLDLPATSAASGAKIVVGSDGRLYTAIGDIANKGREQNTPDEDKPKFWIYNNGSASGAVLRTTIDHRNAVNESSANNPSIGSFYGFGLTNPIGLTVDPVTGYLWGIEGGSRLAGEVGQLNSDSRSTLKVTQVKVKASSGSLLSSMNMTDNFDNGSIYPDPKLMIINSSLLSSLVFLNSTALGSEYTNNLFLGDIQGNIYYFDLDKNRENIPNDFLSNHIFATGFGPISDLKIGPDGSLYVLTLANNTSLPLDENTGSVYRIAKDRINLPVIDSSSIAADYWGLFGIAIAVAASLIFWGVLRIRSIGLTKNPGTQGISY